MTSDKTFGVDRLVELIREYREPPNSFTKAARQETRRLFRGIIAELDKDGRLSDAYNSGRISEVYEDRNQARQIAALTDFMEDVGTSLGTGEILDVALLKGTLELLAISMRRKHEGFLSQPPNPGRGDQKASIRTMVACINVVELVGFAQGSQGINSIVKTLAWLEGKGVGLGDSTYRAIVKRNELKGYQIVAKELGAQLRLGATLSAHKQSTASRYNQILNDTAALQKIFKDATS